MLIEVNGARVFANTGGQPFDPAKPCVVLVHGAGYDHTAWRYQSRYLAHHGASVVAVDLPGHGRSEGEPLGSVVAMADWVDLLIGALGVEEAFVVGHSLGALVALDAAGRHGSVAGVVLIGGSTAMPVHPELLESSAGGDTHVLDLMRAWMHGSHVGGHPDPGRWMMGESWLLQSAIGLDVLHADLAACNTYDGGDAAAASAGCPVLLITGRHDRMTPVRGARALAETLPDARLEILEHSGHLPMAEQPVETTKLIASFVENLQGG